MEAQLAEREAELGRYRQELARTQRLLQDARAAAIVVSGASSAAEEPWQALASGEAAKDGSLSAPKRAASAGDRPRNLTPLAPRSAIAPA